MAINIFDTHCHYDDKKFDADREEIIKAQFDNGVEYLVHAATDIKSSLFGIEMSKKYDNFYTSVGIHPECLENFQQSDIEKLKKLTLENKVVAIGEIGLDYYWTSENKDLQLNLFEQQLKLSKETGLPVIIHSREATKDTIDLLNKYKPRGVVHCFSGSSETAKEIINLGMYIGFTGVVTFNNAKKTIQALKVVPKDKIVLETDCPYMAPEPMRGKRCESRMIEYTAAKVAEILEMPVQNVIDMTNANAKKLYGLNK